MGRGGFLTVSDVSSATPVKILALGGCGEIGLNSIVLESHDRAIVIDAGLMLPSDRAYGSGVFVPSFDYLERTRPHIEAIVLTHAHEDHIGALPHLLRRLEAPVYGSETALAFARRRLADYESPLQASLRPLVPGQRLTLGPFTVEAISVTHSTPDSLALAVDTPGGLVVHTGDFKIDDTPPAGEPFCRRRFGELGARGVEMLLSDSTNAERSGRCPSESTLRATFGDLMAGTRGRFIFCAFASHLHRLRQVIGLSIATGRRVVALGRRMAESVRIGLELGHLSAPPGTFLEPEEAAALDSDRLTFLAGGSQGERLSSLWKLAHDAHPHLRLRRGDAVALSSRFIPGNERYIHEIIDRLMKSGAEVFHEPIAQVHVSGHAYRDELAEMIGLTQPRNFVPVHGEYRHLNRHLALALEAGIPAAHCCLLQDGESAVLANGELARAEDVGAGRILLEGGHLTDPALIEERRSLGQAGTVVVALARSSQTGRIVAGPNLVVRGLPTANGAGKWVELLQAELRRGLDAGNTIADRSNAELEDEIVRTVRDHLGRVLGLRPTVLPCLMEV